MEWLHVAGFSEIGKASICGDFMYKLGDGNAYLVEFFAVLIAVERLMVRVEGESSSRWIRLSPYTMFSIKAIILLGS